MLNDDGVKPMNNDYITTVTLECLLNKQYNTLLNARAVKEVNKKDVRFYKKRIFNLTKELLTTSDKPALLSPDVKHAFEHYIRQSIQYFKTLDNNDILQKDYDSLTSDVVCGDAATQSNQSQAAAADKLMMRSIQVTNSLDTFVKKTTVTKRKPVVLPHQKEINLKDPILRNKGVPKKKNITNKYGENKKSNEGEEKIEEEKQK